MIRKKRNCGWLIAALLFTLLPACNLTGTKHPAAATSAGSASDNAALADSGATGKYKLVTVAGQKVPTYRAEGDQGIQIVSGTMTLKADGTFISDMNYGKTPGWPAHRDFKGTYSKQGEEYALQWEGAGWTPVKIEGPRLLMNNEGIVFIYWKDGARSPTDAELTYSKKVEGALEGEALPVLGTAGGQAQVQPMEGFGPEWSGGAQLWWRNAKPGDKLDLGLSVKQRGNYKLSAQFTKAKDYGIAQFILDGKKLDGPVDFYHDGVIPSGVIDLGTYELDALVHKLTIEIAGANPSAEPAYMVGVDYVKLEPVTP